MEVLSLTLCVAMIALTALCLVKKLNPQSILIVAGVIMMILGLWLDFNPVEPKSPTGHTAFDLVKVIEETFLSNIMRAGFMIATIGGYVALMNHIGATRALVGIAVSPLSSLRRHPYLAAAAAIPIGQLLFITTPSASGLGLLLVASMAPILVELGVSRLTALSVIVAATIFDQGPGSANTAMAAQLIGINAVDYFIRYQLPLVLPTAIVAISLFLLSNRYFDRKDKAAGRLLTGMPSPDTTGNPATPACPRYFALLPILPIVILVLFSPFINLWPKAITVSTTSAMLLSTAIAVTLVGLSGKGMRKALADMSAFWKGMGTVFAGVVTLIVASEIFAKGLISLGFVDSLISCSTDTGLSGVHVASLFSGVIFSAATLMGSGNAAFFSFGPLLPDIAARLGLPVASLVLPLQLSASMGRAISPIAAIIVAIAGFSDVQPIQIVRRNAIPMIGSLIFLIIANFFIL